MYNVQNIWKEASRCLNFDILLKHIVVGFYLDKSETTMMYNSFVSFIVYRIYKSKMYCRNKQNHKTCNFIKDYVTIMQNEKLFETFVSNLSLVSIIQTYRL